MLENGDEVGRSGRKSAVVGSGLHCASRAARADRLTGTGKSIPLKSHILHPTPWLASTHDGGRFTQLIDQMAGKNHLTAEGGSGRHEPQIL